MKEIHLDFSSAKQWSELTQEELRYVLKLRTMGLNDIQVMTYLFFKSNKIKVLKNLKHTVVIEYKKIRVHLADWQIHSLLKPLRFLEQAIPDEVVNLEYLHGCKSVDKYLVDENEISFSFKNYLTVDSLFQLYLKDKNTSELEEMAKILYPKFEGKLEDWEQLAIIMWWASFKQFLSKQYSELFKPASGASKNDILESFNGQIRGLTGGDVTKEKEVHNIGVHRALTELNAKAREVRELNERTKNNV